MMSTDQAVFQVGSPHRTKPSKISVQRQTASSRIALAVCALAIVMMAAMPWWADPGTIRRVIEFSCYLAIAQMWNLLAGYSGLVSVGPQAFIGAGGYALYVLALKFGVNPFLGVGLSVVLPTFLAVPTYALLHRLDGPYFAIGTWVIAEAVRLLTTNLDYVNNGAGLTLRVMSRYNAHEREVGMIFLCVFLLLTTVGGILWLLRSRYGLALTAMRDNPIAAESQGVNVRRLRFVVFVLAAAGSGLAGAIYYMAQLRITPASGFNPQWASVCVFIVMVGGIGSIEGPIIGALIYFIADRFFSQYGATYMVVLGIITVLVALYARGGVWGLICRVSDAPWFPVGRKLVRSPD
jgi:branched-chain amino acid transport system permease protein